MGTHRNPARSYGRLAITALAAAALTGCAAEWPVYYRDGVMATESTPDAYECLRDAKAVGGAAYVGFGITERTVDWNIYHMCMRTRGWRLQSR